MGDQSGANKPEPKKSESSRTETDLSQGDNSHSQPKASTPVALRRLIVTTKRAVRDGRALQGILIGLSVGAAAAACVLLFARSRDQVHVVTLATGGATGEYYAFGKAIAQITEKHSPHIKVQVIEAPGSQQNMADVNSHTVDMAMVQSDTPVLSSVQAVAQLYPELFHLIANEEAAIQSMADLRGKRIALMPKGSGSYELFWPLMSHYGLTDQDVIAMPMASASAHEALRDGDVDALFRIIGLGNQAVRDLLTAPDLELIPIQQIGALQLQQPYLEPTVIPRGSYDGSSPIPSQDLPVIAVSALLVANEKVDPEIVKAITKVLYEHRSELIAVNPRAASIQSPEASQNLGFPLHGGARAYYTQDSPPFLVQYAETMGLLLSLLILIFSGVWQFRIWLIGRQKNRADDYNLEILSLIDKVEQAATVEDLQRLRQELFFILRQVVIDLDVDKISPESFQSFTFPWEVAMTTLHHQEMVLHKSEGVLKELNE
ncbi:MAG: TAXI family TRAP transporter solute-binding subunit [Cyanobacteria bacterium J06598_3]